MTPEQELDDKELESLMNEMREEDRNHSHIEFAQLVTADGIKSKLLPNYPQRIVVSTPIHLTAAELRELNEPAIVTFSPERTRRYHFRRKRTVHVTIVEYVEQP